MNVSPIADVLRPVAVDHAHVIRPMKSKLTRVTPARSFDVGWSWVDRAERRHPLYRSRHGGAQPVLPQEEAVSAEASPEEEETSLDAEPAHAMIPTDVESLRRMVDMLEGHNAFLRSRLVAAEETIKSVLGLLAEGGRRPNRPAAE